MRLSLLLTTTLLGATTSYAAAAAPAQNFFNSCSDSSIKVTGKILQASCRNIKGDLKCSKLDLNKCIRNSYGTLEPDPKGSGPHFGDQCINCSNGRDSGFVVAGGPTLVHCQCNPGTAIAQSAWPTAFIDINDIVDNNNGVLECYGTKGTAC
ncbi:Cyanovirin-N [Rhypophila decipiens]